MGIAWRRIEIRTSARIRSLLPSTAVSAVGHGLERDRPAIENFLLRLFSVSCINADKRIGNGNRHVNPDFPESMTDRLKVVGLQQSGRSVFIKIMLTLRRTPS